MIFVSKIDPLSRLEDKYDLPSTEQWRPLSRTQEADVFDQRRADPIATRTTKTTTQSNQPGAFHGFAPTQITTTDINDNRPILRARDDHQWVKLALTQRGLILGKCFSFLTFGLLDFYTVTESCRDTWISKFCSLSRWGRIFRRKRTRTFYEDSYNFIRVAYNFIITWTCTWLSLEIVTYYF